MGAESTSLNTFQELNSALISSPRVMAVDVETVGKQPNKFGLLGVAFGWNTGSEYKTYYMCLNYWDEAKGLVTRIPEFDKCIALLASKLRKKELIGHNIEYDRKWIDASLGIRSAWKADTRIMWHLSDIQQTERTYGLKSAQVKILGWAEANDEELELAVKARGGKLKNGDHYLAPVEVMGKYAKLDILATLQLYDTLAPVFDSYNYWAFYRKVHRYGRLLSTCTEKGVRVNITQLEQTKTTLTAKIEELKGDIHAICKEQIEKLEKSWYVKDITSYKTGRGVANFVENYHKHRRFNPSSPQQKATLFYDLLGLPVLDKTPSGRPKADRATIASLNHPSAKPFVDLSKNEKLLSMTESYLECVQNGKIHFPYNICGTVTGRLGGFKPYALNLPFDSEEVMRPFTVSPGYVGIHADLRSVEPCFIASFSKDPTLLKVHRDGLGDVYLDFALHAFPGNRDLQAEYNPNVVCTDEIKEKFKRERKICKIIHLAVGYTGTAVTVAKTLTKSGIPTTQAEAQVLVNKYWDLFHNVKDLSARCKQAMEAQGYLINPFGRRITVPPAFRKDSMNRLTQSSGHDALVEWVKEIDKLRRKMLPLMSPVLIDTHDSTTWECPEGEYEKAAEIFAMALRTVNSRLNLCVTLTAETKQFYTFYGLKNSED